ncbi:hypothetical protein BSKO_06815 [Bryopsis sp. KO-2023]|nr:hypothetical protein BSKO_06815 [Bryopsis sp. KO-2023]
MSALFSPDSLLGRYEGLLGERSSLENKIKNLEAELRQVRAAATMSRSSRDGQDELDVLLHSFDGSEVFVGRTGSGSPSKQRGVKRGVNSAPKTRSSSTGRTCGTPFDSSQSGWTSVDTFMSTETTLSDSDGCGSKDPFEGFQEKKGHTPSHGKQDFELRSGTFFSALDKRGGGSRPGSNNGRTSTGPLGNIPSGSDGSDKTGLPRGFNSSPQESWAKVENRSGSSIGGGGGGGGGSISTGGGNVGTMEQNTADGHVVFDGDDAPSRLSVMSDGQISKLIGDREVAQFSGLNESQMSKLLATSDSVPTPARFLGPSGGRLGRPAMDRAGNGPRGESGDSNSIARCFSLDSRGGSVGSTAKNLRVGSKLGGTVSGGGGAGLSSFSSVSSLQDTGSLMSENGRMDSKASLDLLCKEMMKGIDEMKSMSQAITRRTNVLASTHSTGDLERASTMPLSSSFSALLLSNSDEIPVSQEVAPSQSKNGSRMVKTDPEIPAILTREMQPFTKDEKRAISPVTKSPEPSKGAVAAPATRECISREMQAFTGDLNGSFGRGDVVGSPTIAGEVPSSVFPSCLTREMQPFDSRAVTINKRSPSLGNGAELLERKVAQESLAVPEQEDNFSEEFCMTESIKKRPRSDPSIDYEEGGTAEKAWIDLPSCFDREMEQFHSSADDLAALDVDWVEGHAFNNEFGEEDGVQKRPPRPRTPLPLQFLRSLGQEPKGAPAEFRTFRNLCEAVYSGGRTSPSDEEIVGAVQGEVNRVLMESPELGNEGGLMDMVESVTKELGTQSLQRRLLSPVLEELSHRSNNIDSVEDPPGEDYARRGLVRRGGIRSPFADYLSDSVGEDDDVEFGPSTSGNPVSHQGFGNRELVCGSTVKPPPKLIECCFSSSSRGDGVVLSRRATIAASQSETTLTDFVVSQAVVSTGTVQFDICCEKLEGWAFVGILAASAMDPVRPRSLAEASTAYGWTSDAEFFEGGTYHYEAQKEMFTPGMNFQLIVDCTRGMVSLRVPQISRHGAKHQGHRRYLVCEMEDLPTGEWRLAIEWLGVAKFELLDVKRWV